MGPLFACMPMCTTFVALGIFGLFVVIAGAYHHPEPTDAPAEPAPPSHAPPIWVFVLISVLAVLTVLAMIIAAPIG